MWALKNILSDWTATLKRVPSIDKMAQIEDSMDKQLETAAQVQQHGWALKGLDRRADDAAEDILSEHKRVSELDREFREAHGFLSGRIGSFEVRVGTLEARLSGGAK